MAKQRRGERGRGVGCSRMHGDGLDDGFDGRQMAWLAL